MIVVALFPDDLGDRLGLGFDLVKDPARLVAAYDDADGRWIVNPMFIEPEGQAEPYACATEGYVEPGGGDAAGRGVGMVVAAGGDGTIAVAGAELATADATSYRIDRLTADGVSRSALAAAARLPSPATIRKVSMSPNRLSMISNHF